MSTAPWRQKKTCDTAESKTVLTEENKVWARERARAAGRRYPNLVDNMAAVQRQREQEAGPMKGLRDGA